MEGIEELSLEVDEAKEDCVNDPVDVGETEELSLEVDRTDDD